jgi:hypothetical protein
MTQNDYIVYAFWGVLPGIQALYLAYLYLEFLSKKAPKTTVSEAFRNLLFLSLCFLVAFIIDRYFLESAISLINGTLDIVGLQLPNMFFRLVTFPVILVLAGKFLKSPKAIEPPKNQILKYNRDRLEKK